jgi:ATP/maltotriose-dependent transcriptional regulator MalT
LETVTLVKAAGEQGFAKIVLAHILCIEGDYDDARQLAEEALVLVQPHPVRERFIARVLAMVACASGDFDKAREQARWALAEDAYDGIRLWILPVFALLLAHDGEPEQAAGLLGLIFAHPANATGWLEKWALMNALRAQLAEQLGAEGYAEAWQQGTTLDLDTVVDDLLITTDDQAKQPLLDPLTDRELEVLHLIADGLTNHQIAEMMTVTEGTIRSHVYNLSQKLGVRNRTSAAARGRALHLLR